MSSACSAIGNKKKNPWNTIRYHSFSLPVKLIFYWTEFWWKTIQVYGNSSVWMQNWHRRPTQTAFHLQTSLCIQMSSVLSHFRAISLWGWKSDHKFHPTQAFATQALPSSHCLWKLSSKLHFRCLLFVSDARGEKKKKLCAYERFEAMFSLNFPASLLSGYCGSLFCDFIISHNYFQPLAKLFSVNMSSGQGYQRSDDKRTIQRLRRGGKRRIVGLFVERKSLLFIHGGCH